MNAIEIKSLSKTYDLKRKDKLHILNNIHLNVKKGSVFGLLGPNGAGKTTLLKILLNISFYDKGKITILNQPHDCPNIKKRVNYLPEKPYFYPYLTGKDFLTYMASFYNNIQTSTIDDLLTEVGLKNQSNIKIHQYSKGMQQRLGIASCLLNEPDILFLDEPTTGLDPIAHKDICTIIRLLKEKEKTVFLLSHELSDIETLCDHIGILHQGNLIKTGPIENFVGSKEYKIIFSCVEGLPEDPALLHARLDKKTLTYTLLIPADEINIYISIASKYKLKTLSVENIQKKLEDTFHELIKINNI